MSLIGRHNSQLIVNRDRAVLAKATQYLRGKRPTYWFDFMSGECYFNGKFVGPTSSAPGFSHTRASVGTAENSNRDIIHFASGERRQTDKGWLVEPTRQNLFLNSAVGATQSITVAAVVHTLSFRGTGTITLSGASTAGPLVGTGVNNTVLLAFTPSAGTLTLTVSGSVTNVQLEAGEGASSWIPTAGSSVIRAADEQFIPVSGISFPVSLWAEFERRSDPGTGECLIQLDDNTASNSVSVRVNSSDVPNAVMNSGGVVSASPVSGATCPLATRAKIAGRFSSTSVHGAHSGTLYTLEDTSVTLPAAGPSFVRFGYRIGATASFCGYLRRLAIFDSALSDADLQLITTL